MTEQAAAKRSSTRRWLRVLQALASVALAALLLVVALPRVTGTQWTEIAHELARPSPLVLAGLFAVWQLGLVAYSSVLAASMRGLTMPQGYVLNFVSSAVANLVPFGGAAGVGVMWWMARAWGFTTGAFGLFTLVTFVVNIVAKAAVPGIALAALVLSGGHAAKPVVEAAAVGAGVCLLVLGILLALLLVDGAAEAVGRFTDWVGRRLQRWFHSHRTVDWSGEVLRLRDATGELIGARWRTLTVAMVGYQALQALLMWLCLWAVGGPTGWAQVLCAFASGRLLTSVVLTPGGTGFAETGAAAVLVALGGDPAPSVAGVLLFSVFTYALEIPFGALCAGVFLLRRSWRRPVADVAVTQAP